MYALSRNWPDLSFNNLQYGSEKNLFGLRCRSAIFVIKVNRELGKLVVKLVLLARYHVKDAQTRDTAHSTHKWKQLQLKVDRLESLNFPGYLGVTAADEHLTLVLTVRAH